MVMPAFNPVVNGIFRFRFSIGDGDDVVCSMAMAMALEMVLALALALTHLGLEGSDCLPIGSTELVDCGMASLAEVLLLSTDGCAVASAVADVVVVVVVVGVGFRSRCHLAA